MSDLSPWQHGRRGTAKTPENAGNHGHLMSSISTLAIFRSQRGWFRQRYRGSLSIEAFDGPFSSRSRKLTGFPPAERARSTVVKCKTTTFNGHLPLRSGFCQPFNTHRAVAAQRFSSIILSPGPWLSSFITYPRSLCHGAALKMHYHGTARRSCR